MVDLILTNIHTYIYSGNSFLIYLFKAWCYGSGCLHDVREVISTIVVTSAIFAVQTFLIWKIRSLLYYRFFSFLWPAEFFFGMFCFFNEIIY